METPTAGYRRQNHNSAARTLAASRVKSGVCVCVRERDREQGFWVKEQQRKEQESY